MKIKYLLFAFVMISAVSCSTAYKSGQTPDDVYYSPVRVVEENTRRVEDRYEDRRNTTYGYSDYEERQIRMAMRDRRWRDINYNYGYDYRYSPYSYGYNYGYYYNPYYYNSPVFLPGYTITNPKTTTPRTTSLGSYSNNNTVVTSDGKTGQTRWVQPSRTYNNSNNNSRNSSGSSQRRVIYPSYSNENSAGRNNSSNSGSNNSRTYSPSSSNSGSSSSGSSSSGGGGTVTRPARGN